MLTIELIIQLTRKDLEKMRKYNGRKIVEMEYWLSDRTNEFF